MSSTINSFSSPLKLLSNRVRRSYSGGMLLEQWQGRTDPKDGSKPEEWIASVVEARNNDHLEDEGLSIVQLNEHEPVKLADLIREHAEGILGTDHVKKYGANTALLTKILDAAVRLSIQVHPTKQYARDVFNSAFGKTEAWYILEGRTINGEPPYVLIGFKPGITREKWKKYFEEQDIGNLISSLHKFYVNPGDVYLIAGGVPHAIGAGCLMIEIQEPTDYTMRVARTSIDGNPLPDFLCHQGAGFDQMLDCFEYDGLSREETYSKYFKTPEISVNDGNSIAELITKDDTDCFSMTKLCINNAVSITDDSFKSCIILKGEGELLSKNNMVTVKQSDTLIIPASAGETVIKNTGSEPLQLVLCYPPK